MSELSSLPHLSVVSGNPSAEELAVVIAVIRTALAQSAAGMEAKSKSLSHWHRNPSILRGAVNPGHGQWAASARRGLH